MDTLQLQYALSADDFLQYQLFIASQSKRIRNQRLRGRLIVTLAMVVFGTMLFERNNRGAAYAFFAAGFLTFLTYPLYLRQHYRRHYENFIAEHYASRVGKTSNIDIDQEVIRLTDPSSETKLGTSEIEEVVEIGSHFFVKLKSSGHIIIPKNKVPVATVQDFLRGFAQRMNLSYRELLNWRWR